ncbi:MAG TPA: FtsX-like permease family protein [Candidatus Hydrogenedentes bacterium]|nr:FtsX-like permease family protein [Candidatus Hydrogenedentota bacterium]
MTSQKHALFAEDASTRRLILPWNRAAEICWRNVLNRRGRFLLIFVSIGVVVAFFVSTLAYQSVLAELRRSEDVPVRAALERANLLTHGEAAEKHQRDRTVWLLFLSGMLCFVGVCNTMYMSVTERFQEIGTLKCLGALDGFIIRLFLIESVFVGLVGSMLGAAAGCLLMVAQLTMVLEVEYVSLALLLRTLSLSVPLAVAGGTLLTVLAAVYPTWAAAKMKPVDAMRVEV